MLCLDLILGSLYEGKRMSCMYMSHGLLLLPPIGFKKICLLLQVCRTCETMTALGLSEITTLECLAREFQVRTISLPVISSDEKVSCYTSYLDILQVSFSI